MQEVLQAELSLSKSLLVVHQNRTMKYHVIPVVSVVPKTDQ